MGLTDIFDFARISSAFSRLKNLPAAMKFWLDLLELYGKGGLEVVTEKESDQAAANRPLFIRTVVQADGDVITWVHPQVKSESLWELHQQKLRDKIQSIQLARGLLRYFGFVIVSVPLLFYNLRVREFIPMIATLLIGLAVAWLIRYLIAFLIRFYIRKKINQYAAALLQA